MANNNERYDLSNRLIHFFKKVDLSDGSSRPFPEWLGASNIVEDDIISPLFLLRCCIRNDNLWATWSYRGRIRTIYGLNPAVCFTEMPLAAFIETSTIREENGEKMSTYGLMFKKNELFKIGARPVIYGLSNPSASIPSGKDGKARIINQNDLPLSEQYRYVTFNLDDEQGFPIDWTHEREWRCKCSDQEKIDASEKENEQDGLLAEDNQHPGLKLSNRAITEIGVIVCNDSDEKKILNDILCSVFKGLYSPTKFSFIVNTSKILSTIDLRDFYKGEEVIQSSKIMIEKYLKYDEDLANETLTKIWELESEVEKGVKKCYQEKTDGACWLWFYNIFDDKVRSLLLKGEFKINRDNKILYLPHYIEFTRPLAEKQEMFEKLANKIKQKLGMDCGYFSVRGVGPEKKIYDNVPFDASDIPDEYNRIYNNYADDF